MSMIVSPYSYTESGMQFYNYNLTLLLTAMVKQKAIAILVICNIYNIVFNNGGRYFSTFARVLVLHPFFLSPEIFNLQYCERYLVFI